MSKKLFIATLGTSSAVITEAIVGHCKARSVKAISREVSKCDVEITSRPCGAIVMTSWGHSERL